MKRSAQEKLDDLRAGLRSTARPDFEFTRVERVPFSAGGPPLDQARLALITTAGLVFSDQPRFDLKTPGGDPSFREIPLDRDRSDLRISWDDDGSSLGSRDLRSVFPIDLLEERVARGEIGSLAATHWSASGSIPDPERLVAETAPALADRLLSEQVDLAFLAPA